MSIPIESFEVQIESPVDFASLERNGMNMNALMTAQQMFPYFEMLNGPTYEKLVKEFWIRAEVYDLEAAKAEELKAVTQDPSLRGNTRKEMGLESFRKTEIRSAVMGIPITITKEVIAKACRVTRTRRFLWNASRSHPLLERFKSVVMNGNLPTKLVDIEAHHMMLLKFMTECFFQKGGGSDQPNVDHKMVLYFLATFDKINLPKYLMHHLCWAVKERIRGKRKLIPYGRLLSEIFTQGKLLETLRRNNLASDKALRTRTGKMINGKTLQNMKIIKKFSPNEKDLKESSDQTKLMKDFPPIIQERNPEVLTELISGFVKESGGITVEDDTPDAPDEVPLLVRRKRTLTDTGSEATGAQTKKSRKDKSEASNPDNSSAPAPKRKRGKGESSSIQEAASKVVTQKVDADTEEERVKKQKAFEEKYTTPMTVVTPAMARMAKEYADNLIAAKKQKKMDYLAERSTKLKSLGLENYDEYYQQKIAEVRQIAGSVEQQVVEEATEMLELIPEASEAGASEAAPESSPTAEPSKPSATASQTSDLPSSIQTPLSPSKPSPKPSETNYSTILKSIGEMLERRVEICNKLPTDHPFQPPTIAPLNMILPDNPQPSQPTKSPLQEEQTSAAAEGSEDPEEPQTVDLPKCDSPSNLYSLEKHLGGELQATPEKATTSVPEKTDVVNHSRNGHPRTCC